jgi:hypothetical protein
VSFSARRCHGPDHRVHLGRHVPRAGVRRDGRLRRRALREKTPRGKNQLNNFELIAGVRTPLGGHTRAFPTLDQQREGVEVSRRVKLLTFSVEEMRKMRTPSEMAKKGAQPMITSVSFHDLPKMHPSASRRRATHQPRVCARAGGLGRAAKYLVKPIVTPQMS